MPFIHVPTWHILDHPVELIFGIAAVGAQYCFESKVSQQLYFAGKALLMNSLRAQAEKLGPATRSCLALTQSQITASASGGHAENESLIETVQALIVLMAFATWEPKVSLVQESFILQGILAHVARDVGLAEKGDLPVHPLSTHNENDIPVLHRKWRQWADEESSRRTKLIAFTFLHTHSIAYNFYPVLRSNEVNLRLPCSTKEWNAPNEATWHALTCETKRPQLLFQEALSLLLRNRDDAPHLEPIPTPLGNYVLLHGLLQRIHILRDLSVPITSKTAALPVGEVKKLE